MLETQLTEMKEDIETVILTAQEIDDERFTNKLEIIQSLANIVYMLEEQYKLITPQPSQAE